MVVSAISPDIEGQIETLINEAIRNRLFPGIEILLARADRILFHRAYGHFDRSATSPALPLNACFDLASLTKPLATAGAVLHLIDGGVLGLETPICSILAEADNPEYRAITVGQLLTHTAGLPAWAALFEPDFDQQQGWVKLLRLPLLYPPGTNVTYSCLGYILLGEAVRRISGMSLNRYCYQHLYKPLGIDGLTFNPDLSLTHLVPTAFCPWRRRLLRGIVHDENAYLFDGEGGNAGLFGTATAIFQYCQMLWRGGQRQGQRVLSSESVRLSLSNRNRFGLPPRGLGWDINPGGSAPMSCGQLMPPGSLGHLGFTGTSLWMDRVTATVVIVLSNRVNFSREHSLPQMRLFRPRLHDLLLSRIYGKTRLKR
jgi:serine-type D-Ala-D-Ala carboxypeptidase